MLRETVLDLRNVVREMPWFGAAVLLLVAIGVGVNASFFAGADGDRIRVSASRIDDEMNRLSHHCGTEKIPGFTLIVAVRQYRVELSVPMRPLFEDARAEKGALGLVDLAA